MVVDDRYAIVGSANINDRSLDGDRDSEIAVVIEDTNLVESRMGGRTVSVGQQIQSFRTQLFMEHFGFTQQESVDVLQARSSIAQRARRNTEIYREVFACYPDDNVHKISELEQFKETANPEKYQALKQDIQGFAVEWPTDFLKNEDLDF